jgi:hypothetical protein
VNRTHRGTTGSPGTQRARFPGGDRALATTSGRHHGQAIRIDSFEVDDCGRRCDRPLVSRSPIGGFAGSGAGGSSLVLALCPRRALTAGGCTRLRAAPVPQCTIHSATKKRKGPLAPFTADRSAPRGSLGYVAGDPQLPGGTRLTLAPRPPGLPPRPARPTRGAWPVARLQAARCAPRASAGAASRLSSGPFEVEARTQGIPRRVLPRASLTERSILWGPNATWSNALRPGWRV